MVLAADAREALAAVERGSFALVYLALEIRGGVGLDVLREMIRVAGRDRPLFVASTTNRHQERSARSIGASVVFVRPFTTSSFEAALLGVGLSAPAQWESFEQQIDEQLH